MGEGKSARKAKAPKSPKEDAKSAPVDVKLPKVLDRAERLANKRITVPVYDRAPNQCLQIKLRELDWRGKKVKKNRAFETAKSTQYHFEHAEFVRSKTTRNHLVNAVYHAYTTHSGVEFRPDDIMLAISLVVGLHVTTNSEDLRETFVSHQGKQDLVVRQRNVWENLPACIKKAQEQLTEVTKTNLAEVLSPTFTTTTPLIQTALDICVMNTFKSYFTYKFEGECGIPFVNLVGTQQDWLSLHETYNAIKQVLPSLEGWYEVFDPIMHMFTSMRSLQEEGVVDAPDWVKQQWKNVISISEECTETQMSGWFRYFDANIANEREPESTLAKDDEYEDWDDVDLLSSSIASVPVKVKDFYEFKMHLHSGFVGFRAPSSAEEPIRLVVGWGAEKEGIAPKDSISYDPSMDRKH